MKIVFRTDASLQIGTGHVMRCLTLAEVLRESGAQCKFICREHPGNLIDLIRQRGFLVTVLSLTIESAVIPLKINEEQPSYASWLGVDFSTDANQTKGDIVETRADWLIVDHYALDYRWEQILRPVCSQLMVIDDLANRVHDCDLLLDQNLGRSKQDYSNLVPKSCIVLLGPKYALLRPEFAILRGKSLRRRSIPQLKKLLISMGGVDQLNATSRVLESMSKYHLPADLKITVVMGSHAPWLEQVQYLSQKMPVPTIVKCNIENMAQVMAHTDLAIGGAGTTSWERCCMGLPSMVCNIADNQIFIANALQAVGAAKIFFINDQKTMFNSHFAELVDNPNEILKMSACAANVTDGVGSNLVSTILINTNFSL